MNSNAGYGAMARAILVTLAMSIAAPALADDTLQLVVTGSNRAIVILNGERVVLGPNSTPHDRLSLQEADSDRAIVLLDGEQIVLDPSSIAAPILVDDDAPLASEDEENDSGALTIWAEPGGMFFARGTVNRRSVRFLVDTGADTVVFSSVQADRLGLDYKNGRDGYASTASGIAPLKSLTLKRVSVGDITLRNVAANVILGRFPDVPLLGGSFLNKVSMVRDGNRMELKRR